jgi:hypothetical protein
VNSTANDAMFFVQWRSQGLFFAVPSGTSVSSALAPKQDERAIIAYNATMNPPQIGMPAKVLGFGQFNPFNASTPELTAILVSSGDACQNIIFYVGTAPLNTDSMKSVDAERLYQEHAQSIQKAIETKAPSSSPIK